MSRSTLDNVKKWVTLALEVTLLVAAIVSVIAYFVSFQYRLGNIEYRLVRIEHHLEVQDESVSVPRREHTVAVDKH